MGVPHLRQEAAQQTRPSAECNTPCHLEWHHLLKMSRGAALLAMLAGKRARKQLQLRPRKSERKSLPLLCLTQSLFRHLAKRRRTKPRLMRLSLLVRPPLQQKMLTEVERQITQTSKEK